MNQASELFTLPIPFGGSFGRGVTALLERMTALDRCRSLYNGKLRNVDAEEFPARVLEALDIDYRITAEDLERIPRTGPVVIVANHPFGAVEGLILADLLGKIRPDVRIMANFLLKGIPELHRKLIAVDPFAGKDAARRNVRPLRDCIRWLKGGGALVVFPAGEVAHLDLRRRQVADPEWSANLAGLVRASGASVLPVFFRGQNGPVFHALGLMHPRFRTTMLARELLNKRQRKIELGIGRTVPFARLQGISRDRDLVDYLRFRTYLLEKRKVRAAGSETSCGRVQTIDPPRPASLLAEEVAGLSGEHLLVQSGPLSVFQAEAREIPELLLEIGRLREVTFRAVGEGSGLARDLDSYDGHYRHLFIWNRDSGEIVGAYRVGMTDKILEAQGIKGLYSQSLFRFRPELLEKIGPSLELGRSFVRPEYQRSYAPLLLLWRGIGEFVNRNPQYRRLFGPVSISRDYCDLSRQLMAGALERQCTIPELSRLIQPRVPLRMKPLGVRGCSADLARSISYNLEELPELIADLAPEQGGIPVLLRHYLNLGGKVLGFNVDPEFSDVLDALIMVDLARTERRSLERYLGKKGAEAFLQLHAAGESMPRCA